MFTTDYTSLPRCYAALLWLQVPIFQRMIAPSFSGSSISRHINTVLLELPDPKNEGSKVLQNVN
jgi:hypothetical protein